MTPGPTHAAPRAVGRRLERRRVAEATDDVRLGPHRSGDDAQLAAAGPDRPLARDEQLVAEVDLLGDVVVVARDGRVEPDARPPPPHHAREQVKHHLAVEAGVVLRPEQVAAVAAERRRTGEEHGEVGVAKRLVVAEAARNLDVVLGEPRADVAAPRVEHQPDGAGRVEADLDEVVAAAERPDLAGDRPRVHARGELVEPAHDPLPLYLHRRGTRLPG